MPAAALPVPPDGLPCPACGQGPLVGHARVQDREYRSSEEAHDYFRCTACESLVLHPMPLDRLGEIYPPNYYSYTVSAKRAEGKPPGFVMQVKEALDRRGFAKLLASVPGGRVRALDVGGGDGWLLGELRALDARVQSTTVVDLDPTAAERARANGHQAFVSRIEDFTPPEGERYELILLLNLIEHVAEPQAMLDKLAGLLAPGGRLLVKTPNAQAWDAEIFRHGAWGGYHAPRHWVIYSAPAFARAARKAGLKVASWHFTQGAPFWTVGLLAWLEDRGLLRITKEQPMPYHPAYGPLAAAFAGLDFVRAALGAATSQMAFELVRAEG